MSYLETKRNALMNSVASSSGGLELLETVTIDTPIQNIDISVDTDTYKTFVLSIDLTHSSTNANWIYWGVNGSRFSNGYSSFSNGICEMPGTTRNTTLICAKDLDGYLTYFAGGTSSETFENVNSLRVNAYNGTWASGTVKVYGLKDSIIL